MSHRQRRFAVALAIAGIVLVALAVIGFATQTLALAVVSLLGLIMLSVAFPISRAAIAEQHRE